MSLASSAALEVAQEEWEDEAALDDGDRILELEYPHVARFLKVPPLVVGTSKLVSSQNLPSLLSSLLSRSQQIPNFKRQQERLLADVKDWLSSDSSPASSPFVILGSGADPTVKSAISASLISQLLLSDVLVGAVHYCRRDAEEGSSSSSSSSSPFLSLLSSLSAQLAAHVPGFDAALSPTSLSSSLSSSSDLAALFDAFVGAPLRSALSGTAGSQGGRAVVVFLDALDALGGGEGGGRAAELLAERFAKAAPGSVRLVVTADEGGDVARGLGKFRTWRLGGGDDTARSTYLASLRADLEFLSANLDGFTTEELGHVSAISDIVAKVKALREDQRLAYLEGTRLWVFSKVEQWVSRPSPSSPLFLLFGVGGTGKSVVSAKLCDYLESRRAVRALAVHFCRHDHAAASSPAVLLSSLAAQLASQLPAFGAQLLLLHAEIERALNNGDVDDVFDKLIAEPLRRIAAAAAEADATPFLPEHEDRVLLVIDALDELPRASLRPVLNLLSSYASSLPSFVRIFLTSREQGDIKQQLSRHSPLELRVDEQRNRQDLRLFLNHLAASYVHLEMSTTDIENLVEKRWPGISMKGRLKSLEQPLTNGKHCYNVATETLSKRPGYDSICAISEQRPDPPPSQDLLTPHSIESLFRDAQEARLMLRSIIASSWTTFKPNSTAEQPVKGTTEPWVDDAVDPGLKGAARSLEKVANDYNNDLTQLKDVARVSLIFHTCTRLVAAVAELRKRGVEVISLKNKYLHATPMGYRDLNLCVQVPLADGRKHICEIQMNLHEMLAAKEAAHVFYEVVRSELPRICMTATNSSAKPEEVECFIMNLLHSSIMSEAVRMLDEKSAGLFIYARLLEAEMKAKKANNITIDFNNLAALPSGLDDMYRSNFSRTFSSNDEWELCRFMVSMIVVAREPLPEDIIKRIISDDYAFESAKLTMSLLFPTREGRFEVMHKSVVDWLKRDPTHTAKEDRYILSSEHIADANATLARQIWLYKEWLQSADDEYSFSGGERYAVSFGHVHLTDALSLPVVSLSLIELWIDMLLTPRNPTSCAEEGSYELSAYMATEAGLKWILVQATLGRNLLFAIELRSLLSELKAVPKRLDCHNNIGLSNLINLLHANAWLIGTIFNSIYNEQTPECRKIAAETFIQAAPVTSAWAQSPAFNSMTKHIRFTMPKRVDTSRVLMVLRGGFTDVIISNDGHQLVTSCYDKTIKIWDADSCESIRTLFGHSAAVMSVTLSRDGFRLVSASADQTLRVWDFLTGEALITIRGHTDAVNAVAFLSDSKSIVSVSADCTLRVWDITSGKCQITLTGHTSAVTDVCVTKCDLFAISSSNDKSVRVWDLTLGECQRIMTCEDMVNSVCVTKRGLETTILSGSEDGTIKFWRFHDGECLRTVSNILYALPRKVLRVRLSDDETKFVSVGWCSTLKVWNFATGELEMMLDAHADFTACVAITPDLKRAMSGSWDGTMNVWDVVSTGGGEPLVEFLDGHTNWVHSVVVSGNNAVISGCYDKTIKIWNPETGLCTHTLNGHTLRIMGVAVSRDCSRIYSASWDKTAKCWDAITGECVFTATASDWLYTVDVSSDKRMIATGGADKLVRLWRVEENDKLGDVEHILSGHSAQINKVEFSPDDSIVCSISADAIVKVWKVSTGECLFTMLHNDTGCAIPYQNADGTISPETRPSLCLSNENPPRIVSASWDSTIMVWNSSTGEKIATLRPQKAEEDKSKDRRVTCVHVSEDNRRLVSGGYEWTVKIWDFSSYHLIHILYGHQQPLRSVCFSSDSSFVASCGNDNTVKIWDTDSFL